MKKPKIIILMPCWGRVEVFRLVCKQLDLFYEQTKLKIELTVLYILSSEDTEIEALLDIYNDVEHEKDMIFSPNNQLGQKINDGITHASHLGYDYLMNTGSDDLIHPKLMDLYYPFLINKVPIIGISTVFFLEKGQDPVFFFYYNVPYVIGAGRMIHRSVINKVIEKCGCLYEPDLCRGMDTMSSRRMAACGFNQTTVYRGAFPYIVDIKSDVNINSFKSITHARNKSRYMIHRLSTLESHFEILKSFK